MSAPGNDNRAGRRTARQGIVAVDPLGDVCGELPRKKGSTPRVTTLKGEGERLSELRSL
jgi:hypothetical protein